MSDFFDSDIVREELQEINELQMSIYKNAMKFGTFSRDDKVEHIEKLTELLEEYKLDELFECKSGHPIILKRFLGGDISLETFVIYDIIFSFSDKFDEKLLDPVWETVSMKIRKYKPFLNINVFNFKKILREIVNE